MSRSGEGTISSCKMFLKPEERGSEDSKAESEQFNPAWRGRCSFKLFGFDTHLVF